MSTVSTFNYDSYASVSSSRTLQKNLKLSSTNGAIDFEYWLNLNDDAVAQVETVTIEAVGATDCYYLITVNGATDDQSYVYFLDAPAAPTTAEVAAQLAKLVNTNGDVSAMASTNTIVITSEVPGTGGAFVVAVDCKNAATGATISSQIATTTTTAASGTAKTRKVASGTLNLTPSTGSATSAAKPVLTLSNGTWFNGANPATQQSTIPTATFTGPLTMDTLIAVS